MHKAVLIMCKYCRRNMISEICVPLNYVVTISCQAPIYGVYCPQEIPRAEVKRPNFRAIRLETRLNLRFTEPPAPQTPLGNQKLKGQALSCL